jgi:predicted nucleic acid-binding protein
MKLVVDANELFAGIIAKGKNLQSWTLGILFSDEVELFAPFRLLAELEKNRDEIRSKSGFSLHDFEAFVGILELRVRFIPLERFLDMISEAKVLAPHLKDVEYFALAFKLWR